MDMLSRPAGGFPPGLNRFSVWAQLVCSVCALSGAWPPLPSWRRPPVQLSARCTWLTRDHRVVFSFPPFPVFFSNPPFFFFFTFFCLSLKPARAVRRAGRGGRVLSWVGGMFSPLPTPSGGHFLGFPFQPGPRLPSLLFFKHFPHRIRAADPSLPPPRFDLSSYTSRLAR